MAPYLQGATDISLSKFIQSSHTCPGKLFVLPPAPIMADPEFLAPTCHDQETSHLDYWPAAIHWATSGITLSTFCQPRISVTFFSRFL